MRLLRWIQPSCPAFVVDSLGLNGLLLLCEPRREGMEDEGNRKRGHSLEGNNLPGHGCQ